MTNNNPIIKAEDVTISKALDLSKGEIISLVGGGGKSTLMKTLALELADSGYKVIITTTTHILRDQGAGYFILGKDKKSIYAEIQKAIISNNIITAVCRQEPTGKLVGPDPDIIPGFLEFADFVIVEADGAQRKPLKAPNQTEPVIVPETSIVIAVAGIDGVGKVFKDIVFRHEIASKLTGLSPEDVVTPGAVATLMAHPEGITRTSPPHARRVAFINKVDDEEKIELAKEIASSSKIHPVFSRVIIGCLGGSLPKVQFIQINQTR